MDAAESFGSEDGGRRRQREHESTHMNEKTPPQTAIGDASLGERKCTAWFLQAFEGYGDLDCNHVAIWGGDGMNWEGGRGVGRGPAWVAAQTTV